MKQINLILLIFVLVIANACKKENKDIEASFIEESISKIKINPNVKWIVILPGLGCHGCIQEGEGFMQDYIENKDILFVLTKIESLKILQKKINISIKEHTNIYLDRSRVFDIPTDNTIYPCIVQLEKNKVISHEFQSPDNSTAFQNLKELLAK